MASHVSRVAPRLAGLIALTVSLACGGPSADTIDREVFIATYVDLRVAALDTDTAKVGTEEREEVLRRHGVTAEDLTTFAEVHATDLEFMRDVWNEVELRLDRAPEDEGSSS